MKLNTPGAGPTTETKRQGGYGVGVKISYSPGKNLPPTGMSPMPANCASAFFAKIKLNKFTEPSVKNFL